MLNQHTTIMHYFVRSVSIQQPQKRARLIDIRAISIMTIFSIIIMLLFPISAFASGTPYGGSSYSSGNYNGTNTRSGSSDNNTPSTASGNSNIVGSSVGVSGSSPGTNNGSNASPSGNTSNIGVSTDSGNSASSTNGSTGHAPTTTTTGTGHTTLWFSGGALLVLLAIGMSIWLAVKKRRNDLKSPPGGSTGTGT